MTKQTLSLGETSKGTRAGAPGHYDLDSALVNADGTIEQGVQTYRSAHTEVERLMADIESKIERQLLDAPAQKKTLAVHVESSMADALVTRQEELIALATKHKVNIDVVRPSGERRTYEKAL
jgi:hypothetical protein